MNRTAERVLSVLTGMAFGGLPMLLALDSRRSAVDRCLERDHDPAA